MGQEQTTDLARWIPHLLVLLSATTLFLALLCWRAWIIGNQLERFIRDTQAQITEFMGKQAQWANVATLALQTFPNLLQGGVQLALSLQDLMYNINRAGGIARVVDTVMDNSKGGSAEVTQPRRGRKPRVVPSVNQTNLEDINADSSSA